jgi:hypothetical protein
VGDLAIFYYRMFSRKWEFFFGAVLGLFLLQDDLKKIHLAKVFIKTIARWIFYHPAIKLS